MLIDSHVHLQDTPLGPQADTVMADVRRVGVHRLLVNGEHPGDWPAVAHLAERFPEVIPFFGVHPWFVTQTPDDWETTLRGYLAKYPAGIGECGIDRWIEPRDEPLQERIFRRHLQIAAELQRPITIHILRAWGWFLEILASEPQLPERMLLHSYGGSIELIGQLAERGAYFSFSGSIFEPRRGRLRETLLAVPADRLLIETDAPAMLPPEGLRPFTATDEKGQLVNHPANLPTIYRAIAQLRGLSPEQLEQPVESNARSFLGDLLR